MSSLEKRVRKLEDTLSNEIIVTANKSCDKGKEDRWNTARRWRKISNEIFADYNELRVNRTDEGLAKKLEEKYCQYLSVDWLPKNKEE